jgi:hypothetical protein
MRKAVFVAGVAVVLAACSGADPVVTVNGVGFDVDDIPIETESSSIRLDVYREALNWVIRDHILMTAAAEEFGVSLAEEDVQQLAAATLGNLSSADEADPRANLHYFRIQARVGVRMVEGLLWREVVPRLPDDITLNSWVDDKLRAAEVEVDPRVGEWRTNPDPGVYEP